MLPELNSHVRACQLGDAVSVKSSSNASSCSFASHASSQSQSSLRQQHQASATPSPYAALAGLGKMSLNGRTRAPAAPNRYTFACPYCAEANLTTNDLINHCNANHANDRKDMICPVCVAMPWGNKKKRKEKWSVFIHFVAL